MTGDRDHAMNAALMAVLPEPAQVVLRALAAADQPVGVVDLQSQLVDAGQGFLGFSGVHQVVAQLVVRKLVKVQIGTSYPGDLPSYEITDDGRDLAATETGDATS